MTLEREYVLGTADAEIQRLGMQHAVWRSDASSAWRHAGFAPGSTIIDVGSGPGFATFDLAALVGPNGRVHAVDQSARFGAYLTRQALARGIDNVVVTTADLEEFDFRGVAADGAWIRWVLAFLRQPKRVLSRLSAALRPGARLAIHEYFAYEAWKLVPRDRDFENLISIIMQSWRNQGGEPNVGLSLTCWLEEIGFEIRSTRTVTDLTRWSDPRWHWPTTFAISGLQRLVELGEVGVPEGERLAAHLRECFGRNPWMFTPAVLEVVAEWPN